MGLFASGRVRQTSRAMYENEREWRDQIIAQLIYLRTAIYFVGFVAACGFSAPYIMALGVSKEIVGMASIAICVTAIFLYLRAEGKTARIERRVLSIDYGTEA